jgi:hypothetical protein
MKINDPGGLISTVQLWWVRLQSNGSLGTAMFGKAELTTE